MKVKNVSSPINNDENVVLDLNPSELISEIIPKPSDEDPLG